MNAQESGAVALFENQIEAQRREIAELSRLDTHRREIRSEIERLEAGLAAADKEYTARWNGAEFFTPAALEKFGLSAPAAPRSTARRGSSRRGAPRAVPQGSPRAAGAS